MKDITIKVRILTLSILITTLFSRCDLRTIHSLSNKNNDNLFHSHFSKKKLGDLQFDAMVLKNENDAVSDSGSIEIQIEISSVNSDNNPIQFIRDKNIQEVTYYLSYQFENQLYLNRMGRKIRPGLCLFQRDYLLTSRLVFNVMFPTSLIKESDLLTIDDKLFGYGLVNMKFSKTT